MAIENILKGLFILSTFVWAMMTITILVSALF